MHKHLKQPSPFIKQATQAADEREYEIAPWTDAKLKAVHIY